jgi:hypothetical protein
LTAPTLTPSIPSNPNSKTSTPSRVHHQPHSSAKASKHSTGERATSVHPLSKSHNKSPSGDSLFDFENEFGDLALPPPALELDQPSSLSTPTFQTTSNPMDTSLNQAQISSAVNTSANQSSGTHARTSTISSSNSASADASRSTKDDTNKLEKEKSSYLGPRKIKKKEETGWRMGDVPLTPRMNETRRREKKSSKESTAGGTTSIVEEETAADLESDLDLDPDDEEDFGAGFVGSPIWSGAAGFNLTAASSPSHEVRHAHFVEGEPLHSRNHLSPSVPDRDLRESHSNAQPANGKEKSANDQSRGDRAGAGGDPSPPPPLPLLAAGNQAGGAWWLDISCPTYADMVQLSKVSLHLRSLESTNF